MSIYKLLLFFALTAPFAYGGACTDQGRWRFFLTFFLGYIKFLLGVCIPFIYFVFSLALAPTSQVDALSPLSLLVETKIWVAPFALWAWVSFLYAEVLRKHRPWVTLGLINGFLGGTLCALGLFWVKDNLLDSFSLASLLLIPLFYIPPWYGMSAIRAFRKCPARPYHLCLSILAQITLWFWAVKEAFETYETLPITVSDKCYVVSASAYGYAAIVRPTVRVDADFGVVRESHQLIRLRAFEAFWKGRWPRNHALFRLVYNRVGPILARAIRPAPLATIAYLALKPVEYFALLVMRVFRVATP